MKTTFRLAILPKEFRALAIFDHKVFRRYKADWFDRDDWKQYECWWMIIGNRKVGCCAFQRNIDFQEDISKDGENPCRPGSLYISTTGILPGLQGKGLGDLLKCWQIAYARSHGFDRIVTNTRASNKPMIALNKKFGFKIIRTTPKYYDGPGEAVLVMERRI